MPAYARDRPDGDEPPPPTRLGEVLWLEPYPDALLERLPDAAPGPEARYETRESVGLAFITALQRLPARQRSVLVLRDVVGFRAAEVAEMLATTEVAIHSALQRARSSLEALLPPPPDRVSAQNSPRERELAESFAEAFEQGDMDRVVSLLSDDASVTMPPEPHEYHGREAIASFLQHVKARRAPGHVAHLVPTRANGQPAFGHYLCESGATSARGTGLFVLTIEGDAIAAISRFGGEDILPRFGLPLLLASKASPRPAARRSERFLQEP